MAADHFRLGETIDPASGDRTGEAVAYDPADLTTHGAILGMTGSGKTGLGVVLLEEALRQGIPALILDPKGDMTNLALQFPDFRASDFEPWVSQSDAERAGMSVAAFAQAEADTWREGLGSWGIDGGALAVLRDAAAIRIYTPGSTAGVPLDLVGNLRAPGAEVDEETSRDEIDGIVTSLLRLAGIDADPLSSPEHVLLANIVQHAWSQRQNLDLATLIGQTMDPPLRKLGVFEVDQFIPPDDRRALAMRLNSLLASPAFEAWTAGAPLDIEAMLYRDGRPQAAVIYLAHLSEAERQFVVTLILSKVVTWMRTLSGTSDLRALIYMDEVFGFVPPSAMPPAKKPILTILKQARAYGVGMVLSTQNPVDLDYKAMSNAGTWMIGRLQTERDKARVLEGIASAAGDVDLGAFDRLISGLGKRQFVLHNTHERGGPSVFTTRWAMSYLAGPLTRDQVRRLEAARTPEPTPAAGTAGAVGAGGPAASDAPAPAQPSPADLGADESTIPPATPDAVPVYYLDPAAPWSAEVEARADAAHVEACLAARVHLLYDETRADVNHREEWEAILFPLDEPLDPERARPVDFDARDFRRDAPANVIYRLPSVDLGKASLFTDFAKDLREHLYRSRTVAIQRNKTLKLYSRVGEAEADFRARCAEAAEAAADAEIAKLRDRIDKRVKRAQESIERAQDRLEQLQVDTKSRRTHEALSVAGDLLTTFLGGRSRSRSLAAKVKGISSRRGLTSRTEQRRRAAEDKLEREVEELSELEEELEDAIVGTTDKWDAIAEEIEPMEIGLEKSDITVDEVALVWVPRA